MKGRDFKPGTIFHDSGLWLKVKTRGPVITKMKGFDGPAVRLTTEDRDGNSHRTAVCADADYETAAGFPTWVKEVSELFEVSIPGAAWEWLKHETEFPQDDEIRWKRIENGVQAKKVGRSYTYVLKAGREDLDEIRESMSLKLNVLTGPGVERSSDDRAQIRGFQNTIERIDAALGKAD